MPTGLAPDGGHVALDKALSTLVPHQGADLIAILLLPEGSGMLHRWGVSTGHWGYKCLLGRDLMRSSVMTRVGRDKVIPEPMV